MFPPARPVALGGALCSRRAGPLHARPPPDASLRCNGLQIGCNRRQLPDSRRSLHSSAPEQLYEGLSSIKTRSRSRPVAVPVRSRSCVPARFDLKVLSRSFVGMLWLLARADVMRISELDCARAGSAFRRPPLASTETQVSYSLSSRSTVRSTSRSSRTASPPRVRSPPADAAELPQRPAHRIDAIELVDQIEDLRLLLETSARRSGSTAPESAIGGPDRRAPQPRVRPVPSGIRTPRPRSGRNPDDAPRKSGVWRWHEARAGPALWSRRQPMSRGIRGTECSRRWCVSGGLATSSRWRQKAQRCQSSCIERWSASSPAATRTKASSR